MFACKFRANETEKLPAQMDLLMRNEEAFLSALPQLVRQSGVPIVFVCSGEAPVHLLTALRDVEYQRIDMVVDERRQRLRVQVCSS